MHTLDPVVLLEAVYEPGQMLDLHELFECLDVFPELVDLLGVSDVVLAERCELEVLLCQLMLDQERLKKDGGRGQEVFCQRQLASEAYLIASLVVGGGLEWVLLVLIRSAEEALLEVDLPHECLQRSELFEVNAHCLKVPHGHSSFQK